jgi:hypothetical protein
MNIREINFFRVACKLLIWVIACAILIVLLGLIAAEFVPPSYGKVFFLAKYLMLILQILFVVFSFGSAISSFAAISKRQSIYASLLVLFVSLIIIFFSSILIFLPIGHGHNTHVSRAMRALTDVKVISTAIDQYESDKGLLPNSLKELIPEYVKTIFEDPWGREYQYSPTEDRKLRVYSLGSDGEVGGIADAADIYLDTDQKKLIRSIEKPTWGDSEKMKN